MGYTTDFIYNNERKWAYHDGLSTQFAKAAITSCFGTIAGGALSGASLLINEIFLQSAQTAPDDLTKGLFFTGMAAAAVGLTGAIAGIAGGLYQDSQAAKYRPF